MKKKKDTRLLEEASWEKKIATEAKAHSSQLVNIHGALFIGRASSNSNYYFSFLLLLLLSSSSQQGVGFFLLLLLKGKRERKMSSVQFSSMPFMSVAVERRLPTHLLKRRDSFPPPPLTMLGGERVVERAATKVRMARIRNRCYSQEKAVLTFRNSPLLPDIPVCLMEWQVHWIYHSYRIEY